jgi:hypothetical protein
MRRKYMSLPIAGIGYYATICASHLANDPEFRKKYTPGALVRYLPETIEILEDEGIVLISIILVSDDNPEMIVIQLAKLNLSEPQFVGLLKSIPGLYDHYMRRLRRMNPSIGGKSLSYKEVHRLLKESCLSTQNSFSKEDSMDVDDDRFVDIVEEKKPRRLKSLGVSAKTL